MDAKIYPSALKGTINIPSSKSFSHRALIAASLAKGSSVIKNVSASKDISATISAMTALGAKINVNGSEIAVNGIKNIPDKAFIDCQESGSTLRFVIPIAAALGVSTEFMGRGKLPQRPITPFIREFKTKGIEFDYNNTMPFSIKGKLQSGEFKIEGDISSQFISGLMFALPLCDDKSVISLTSPLQSKPYADMTVHTLKNFGVNISEKSNNGLIQYIVKKENYIPKNVSVEGDYSQAAFFYVANAISANSDIVLNNLNETDSVQGDKIIVDIAKENKPFSIDAGNYPDLVPILAVLGSFMGDVCQINNAARLRIKESDRLTAVTNAINGIGGKVVEGKDSLTIYPVDKFKGGIVDACNDHRIVMSAAIAATRSDEPIIIKGCEAVEKSYPGFFDDYKSLGGKVNFISE